jgi:hypothetical protein
MPVRDSSNKKNGSRSLSSRLVISLLSLSLPLLAVSGFIGAFFTFQAQQNAIISQQLLIAQNAANNVTSFIQREFTALETSPRFVSFYLKE